MTLAKTPSDFRAHMEDYLDQINDHDETVYIACSNNRVATVISQDKMQWMERALQAKEETLAYAIARDQLIRHHVLPDDKVVDSNDDFWRQF